MSLLNNIWDVKSNNSSIVDLLLKDRKIEDIESFFNPDFEMLHDPFLMKDMQKVIERIIEAREKKEKIVIYGDYDTDGVTSATLLRELLEKLDLEVSVLIPDRIQDGYGLNKRHFDSFKKQGISLLMTVDNGITSTEEIKEASKKGIDVIVIDHHLPHHEIPNCLILDPLQKGCSYPDKYLCAAGVVYKLLQAFHQEYPTVFTESYVKWQLDLVAIGTVVDCAKLVGENRILVSCGLKVLSQTKRPGLEQLIKLCKIESSKIKASDLGYKIGPRLNAAGRISSAQKAFLVLYEKDRNKLIDQVFELQDLNIKRQGIVVDMQLEAYRLIDNSKDFIFVEKDSWHPGIVGLLAGQLVSEFNKLSFVLCRIDDYIVGSIRSPEINLNVVDILTEAKYLLKKFGGHKKAAGFTIEAKNLLEFKNFIEKYFETNVNKEDLKTSLIIDSEMEAKDVNLNLLELIEKFEPFGIGNPCPNFLLRNLKIENLNTVGIKKNHVKFSLSKGQYRFKAIAFNFGKYIEKLNLAGSIDMVFIPKLNSWNGVDNLDLQVIDIKINNTIL